MRRLVHDLDATDADAAAQRIDTPARDDRRQPRPERPGRVVGMTHAVHGQQHVLGDVLDIGGGVAVTLKVTPTVCGLLVTLAEAIVTVPV